MSFRDGEDTEHLLNPQEHLSYGTTTLASPSLHGSALDGVAIYGSGQFILRDSSA